MRQTVWSVKGGVGVTVVAVTLAAGHARRGATTLLVDLGGDVPAALEVPEPDGPGVLDWLVADRAAPEALGRLVVPVGDGLSILHRGTDASVPLGAAGRIDLLAAALAPLATRVVVDAGRVDVGAALHRGGSSLLVTRACYLGLRRSVRHELRPDGVVLVVEPGRCLGRREVADVLGAPVVAEVPLDPSVARAVDAGLLARRAHRSLDRSLGALW